MQHGGEWRREKKGEEITSWDDAGERRGGGEERNDLKCTAITFYRVYLMLLVDL